jgi:hypothetical protein
MQLSTTRTAREIASSTSTAKTISSEVISTLGGRTGRRDPQGHARRSAAPTRACCRVRSSAAVFRDHRHRAAQRSGSCPCSCRADSAQGVVGSFRAPWLEHRQGDKQTFRAKWGVGHARRLYGAFDQVPARGVTATGRGAPIGCSSEPERKVGGAPNARMGHWSIRHFRACRSLILQGEFASFCAFRFSAAYSVFASLPLPEQPRARQRLYGLPTGRLFLPCPLTLPLAASWLTACLQPLMLPASLHPTRANSGLWFGCLRGQAIP